VQTERVAACPVCSDDRREVLHAGLVDRLYGASGSWRLNRCSACGSAYLDPRPTVGSMAAAYDAYYTHEPIPQPAAEPEARARLRKALRNGYLNARYDYSLRPTMQLGRVVVPLFPGQRAAADRHVRRLRRPRQAARVLDIGCGNGEFLLEMREAGWAAQGLETDARAVALARARGLDVREGALEEGAYPARSFDAVTLSHVLEHLHDPVDTLRTSREILRDDGLLWIATPNLASPGHARYGRAWRGLEPPRHLVLFAPSALVHALERAGFSLVSFLRPAGASWVYEASDRIAKGGRPGRGRADRIALRLAVAIADARSSRRHERGEELVALARPRSSSRRERHQTFQGALPDAQSCSNTILSRSVSMGCQKPVCR
jgi:2-polyprenyl-3-methyl-5-hydroxy-6-metoxy-1,4-benzoquinol methylase